MQVGAVPAQTNPVITLVNWNWLHMGFHRSVGAEGPALAEQISRCKCTVTAAPTQDGYKKWQGHRPECILTCFGRVKKP